MVFRALSCIVAAGYAHDIAMAPFSSAFYSTWHKTHCVIDTITFKEERCKDDLREDASPHLAHPHSGSYFLHSWST